MNQSGCVENKCPDCEFYVVKDDTYAECDRCGTAKTIKSVTANTEQDYVTKSPEDRIRRQKYFRNLRRTRLKDLPKGVMLDVGCADGILLNEMESAGWTVQGIDSYDGMQTVPNRIYRSDLLDFIPDERFDLITLIHSFEHMKEPKKVTNKIRNLLKVEGLVLVIVPNYGGSWSKAAGKEWFMLNPAHHYYHYTIAGMINVFQQQGFDVVSVHTHSSYAPSKLQMRLAEIKFYERGVASIQPLRSLLFRSVSALRLLTNWWTDKQLRGAEIQLLVRLGRRT